MDNLLPTVLSITYGANDGALALGEAVTLIVNLSEAVDVIGTAAFSLSNGGTANYTGGTGTNALTFLYSPTAGQDTADLATAANAGFSGVIRDLAGNPLLRGWFDNVNLTGTLVIDVTSPAASSMAYSRHVSQILKAGFSVQLTVTMSEVVKVTGVPTLALSSGGLATYTGGSFTDKLTFMYEVQQGENTSYLQTNGNSLVGAITDMAGNSVIANSFDNLSTFRALAVDTVAPTVRNIAYVSH